MNELEIMQRMNRRRFCGHAGSGLGATALAWLLQQSGLTASETGLQAKASTLRPRVKSCIFLTMEGGASHMDTFDPKPALDKLHGKPYVRKNVILQSNQNRGDRIFVRSPFAFKQYGQCGMDVSELFRETASCVDDMAFVRSVYADSDNHPAALFQFLTGQAMQGSPSIGAWTIYGLGTVNENLPAFVVLRDGRPFGGTSSWGSAFLPSSCQGMQFRGGDHPVLNLHPPEAFSAARQEACLQFLKSLNREHARSRTMHPELEARIANYELAYRMQAEVPGAVDLDEEPKSIQALYGMDEKKTASFGKRCLMARRLVERGVRFVQVWLGGWDSHTDLTGGHRNAAERADRPIAGLLKDLKQRGLLEETLVVWGGEFGRTVDTSVANFKQKPGRDHNPGVMTMWFAGGGIRGGTVVGSSDELGDKAADSPYHLRDVHATLLHLFGLDQDQLTVLHGGRFKRLTDTGGTVIQGILA